MRAAVVVLALVLGNELAEDGFGLGVSAVVGGVAADVQFRLRRPRAVREVLDVLAEHRDGLGIFVLVPFLDGLAEVQTGGFFALLVFQFMRREQSTPPSWPAAINSSVVGARDSSSGLVVG